MIRINLLAAERPTQKKKAAAGPPGALQAYLLVGGLAALTAAVCAGAWLLKSRALDELDTRIASATKRQQDLQVIKSRVEAFERKKAMLDAKVNLIERLKAQQSGPVHMLDELSKSLPDYVWLTSVEQTGNSLKLVGETNSLSAVADFISNLQRSGWFPKVDLVDSAETNKIVKFTLQAEFKLPEPAKPADALQAGGAAAPGGAPGASAPRAAAP